MKATSILKSFDIKLLSTILIAGSLCAACGSGTSGSSEEANDGKNQVRDEIAELAQDDINPDNQKTMDEDRDDLDEDRNELIESKLLGSYMTNKASSYFDHKFYASTEKLEMIGPYLEGQSLTLEEDKPFLLPMKPGRYYFGWSFEGKTAFASMTYFVDNDGSPLLLLESNANAIDPIKLTKTVPVEGQTYQIPLNINDGFIVGLTFTVAVDAFQVVLSSRDD